MKDKNGNFIKIGDSLKNKKGEVGKLQNIGGVTMLVHKDHNGKPIQTIVARKLDLNHFEKVGA